MPPWVNAPPADSDKYQYYVGHATGAQTQAEAVFAASMDALARLALADFGAAAPGGTTGASSALPPNVRFNGVEQIQLYKTRQADDGSFEVYVLYRYPHEALLAEKARQSKPAPPALPARGRLNLQIDHSDALVIVNGYPLAVSVAGEALNLDVLAGQYVDAEFTQYETIRTIRKFYIPAGTSEIREVKLTERPGFVTLSAEPAGTVVDLDEGGSITLPSSEHVKLSVGKHTLSFRKTGYVSHDVTVVIWRDRTINLPKVVLLSSEEKLRRLASPPWVLEVSPIGNRYGTLEKPAVGAFTYGASLDRHLFGPLRLRLGYFRGSGSNDEANPSDELGPPIVTDTLSSTYIEVGLPIAAYTPSALQTFYIEPVWVDASQSVGGMNVNAKVSQQGFGGAVSYRQYFEPGDDSVVVVGLGARAGLTDYYSTSSGLSGKLSLSICFVELLLGI